MGIIDYPILHEIYRQCVYCCKNNNLPFIFHVDSGDYETVIAIDGNTWHKPDVTQTWETVNGDVYCPDIIEYSHNIIIEFEEESGPRKPGAHLAKKGHGHEGDTDTARDTRRNESYQNAGFRVFRLWESNFKNKNWKVQLFKFLIDCYVTEEEK